jgi:hypothetical protein
VDGNGHAAGANPRFNRNTHAIRTDDEQMRCTNRLPASNVGGSRPYLDVQITHRSHLMRRPAYRERHVARSGVAALQKVLKSQRPSFRITEASRCLPARSSTACRPAAGRDVQAVASWWAWACPIGPVQSATPLRKGDSFPQRGSDNAAAQMASSVNINPGPQLSNDTPATSAPPVDADSNAAGQRERMLPVRNRITQVTARLHLAPVRDWAAG